MRDMIDQYSSDVTSTCGEFLNHWCVCAGSIFSGI